MEEAQGEKKCQTEGFPKRRHGPKRTEKKAANSGSAQTALQLSLWAPCSLSVSITGLPSSLSCFYNSHASHRLCLRPIQATSGHFHRLVLFSRATLLAFLPLTPATPAVFIHFPHPVMTTYLSSFLASHQGLACGKIGRSQNDTIKIGRFWTSVSIKPHFGRDFKQK